MSSRESRRSVLLAAVAAGFGGSSLHTLGHAQPQSNRSALPSMTDGPFYPPRRWREREPHANDWDADLTHVRRGAQSLSARGEHLALLATVVDTDGRAIDGAAVEIWQCDARAAYHHPSVPATGDDIDEGFQGFGATTSDHQGQLRFRTIRPVPYPGRTPHIHVKLRHASFGEWTSQLFIAGEPGNERDFLWRRLSAQAQAAASMRLQPADGSAGLRWLVRHSLVVPA